MSVSASLPLRLMPLSVSSAAHAALIAALIVASPLPRAPLAAGETAIEVAMVDESEAGGPVAVPAQPEVAAVAPTPPEEATKASEPEPPLAPSLPEMLPQAEATPSPQTAPEVRPPEVRPPVAKQARPAPRKVEPPKRAAPPRREAVAARPAPVAATPGKGGESRAGAGSNAGRGATPGNAASGAAYAGRVRAILQGRANALGIEDHEGAVGVSFVIGGSGRMESHSITRSSGSGSVDRLIRGMLASASFPPPPGGRFSGSVTIRIQ